MKKTQKEFKESLEKALEIIDYTNGDNKVIMDGKSIDVNEYIFETKEYPFDMCFNELYFELTMSEEEDVDDEFALKYINFVNNTLNPLYEDCKRSELKKIYCAKLSILAKMSSYLTITEYAIDRESDSKVFYYECLNKHSDGKDVSYVLKRKLGVPEVSFKSVVESKMWFLDGEFENNDIIEDLLKESIRKEFDSRLEKLNHCVVTEASYIKE